MEKKHNQRAYALLLAFLLAFSALPPIHASAVETVSENDTETGGDEPADPIMSADPITEEDVVLEELDESAGIEYEIRVDSVSEGEDEAYERSETIELKLTGGGKAVYDFVIPRMQKIYSGWSGKPAVRILVIPNAFFFEHPTLRSVTFANDCADVIKIGVQAFCGCQNLKRVRFSGGEKSLIIEYGAFSHCPELSTAVIPSWTSYIGEAAFSACNPSAEIRLADNSGNFYYSNTGSRHSIIQRGGTVILDGNNNLISAEGGATVILGGNDGVIPNDVTRIGAKAFMGCDGLSHVTLPDGITYIGERSFSGCNLSNIQLPDGIKFLGPYAFDGCPFKNIRIPASLTDMAYQMGYPSIWCNRLEQIEVDPENPVYDSRNDCHAMIETKTNTLVWGCRNTVIPNGIQTIGSEAFRGTMRDDDWTASAAPERKVKMVIPKGVTKIKFMAFSECPDLCEITLPDSLTEIEGGAFSGCGFQTVTIPESVTTIGTGTEAHGGAFWSCWNLSNLVIPGTVASIAENTFESISVNVVYTKSAETEAWAIDHGYRAIRYEISGADGAKEATVTGSSGNDDDENGRLAILNELEGTKVTGIADSAFADSGCLYQVILPDGIKSIGDLSFSGHADLEKILVPASVTEIGEHAFDGCDGLTIYGTYGSYAQTYANAHNIPFADRADIEEDTEDSDTTEKLPDPSVPETPVQEETVHVHSWGPWKTTEKATVFAPESQKRVCPECAKSETRAYGGKLASVMKLPAGSLTLKTKQKTTAFQVLGMADGDYVTTVTSSSVDILKVAKYTKSGSITLKAGNKLGSAKLTVTLAGGASRTIRVKVQKTEVKTKKITGLSKKITLKKGKKETLKPVILPITSKQKIIYASSKPKVASVSAKGVITGKRKGRTKITVKSGKARHAITVTVK